MQIEAEAQAHATRLAAEADAEAIKIKAKADAAVEDPYAREKGLRRIEIARVQAFGSKTVFVPTEAAGTKMADYYSFGLATGMGAQARPKATA